MQMQLKHKAAVLMLSVVAFSGCRKIFDIPDEKDYFSQNADYTTRTFEPILGRTTVFNRSFEEDNSTFPMKFELLNPRFGDGRPAEDMLTKRDVLVWTQEYTGQEKSLAEIEAKRKIENRPVVELRTNGDLIVWNAATRDIITPRDSAQYDFIQKQRFFDVRVSNSGGSKVIRDLKFWPWRERPYETDDVSDINPYTGGRNTTTPGGSTYVLMYPSLSGIVRETDRANMETVRDRVTTRIEKIGDGSSLTFRFLDKDGNPINPARFNMTKWDQVVHGFNMQMTPEYVKYDVAYPIPLARIPTRFTQGGVNGSGDRAHVEFSFSRIGFGNVVVIGTIAENFSIYEKGDWRITFEFENVNPKFTND